MERALMPLETVNLVLASAFTAGCMVIHACRHRADDITLVLVLVLIGLANLSAAALLSRTGPALDPAFAAGLVAYRSHHE
ncbi:hypothetical protein JCM2811A_11710 [Methylorubrum rhodinum]